MTRVSRRTGGDPLRRQAYNRWRHMIRRCTNPNYSQWKDYGGRGITVCARWLNSFDDYYADTGPRPAPGMTVDRVDNDGPYSSDNVRWASRQEQNQNRTIARQYRTHCRNNHEYTAANTYKAPGGGVQCRSCVREASRRYRAQRGAA